ncbi:MAG TPA: class I SAM-dependent methyltransferase [Blastocatellia bacterium]|jgi:ubiquinone/menaquinone biosynthesis C-methylase UbiE|nr:class I SAM-dependent methyltransferase [Blastocatellia bacterium]
MKDNAQAYGDDRYFTSLAVAFVRGKVKTLPPGLSSEEILEAGVASGLRLHKFKRNTELSRVRKVLGIIQGLRPASLLDIGSGRGTFLWPLLDTFPHLRITAIDINPLRVADINAVRAGGISNLQSLLMDATEMDLEDNSVDVVTALEVLEHIASPQRAASEAVRVAKDFVVASVPSKEDDNPEHIHLFDRQGFESLFLTSGAKSVKIDFVLNHMIAVARV